MTWHTVTVPTDQMSALLTKIWSTGGTVTHCQHQSDCVRLTWTTTTHPNTGFRQP